MSKHTMPQYEFGNYKYIQSTTLLDTESLSTNPWSPLRAQEDSLALSEELAILIQVGAVNTDYPEDEQDFEFISRYHAPIN